MLKLKLPLSGLILALCLSGATLVAAQQAMNKMDAPAVLERNVRAHLEFLASDTLNGRGSGTRDELIAGLYIAAQLRQFGIEPAGDTDAAGNKTYIQTVNVGTRQSFTAPPKLSFTADGKANEWTHGKEIAVFRIGAGSLSGPLQKIKSDGKPDKGAIVLLEAPKDLEQRAYRQLLFKVAQQGASAILVAASEDVKKNWAAMSADLPTITATAADFSNGPVLPNGFNVIFLDANAAAALQKTPDGTTLNLGGALGPMEKRQTYNTIGVLPGTDPKADAILLTAHQDHLGVKPNTPGDNIYNGADDDASGCVAVLELARALGAGPRPKRTVYFVTFGSEEAGGFGATYFLKHPPLPLEKIAANLEFEMIGRPDAKVKPEELWLTGYERSNLGPELAKQGAKLVQDPHPDQQFFMRSDNYALAKMGVIAHTVSSFGLHGEYHQANDDIAHIDFKHMTNAINSMVAPVQWLVNSDFKPAWVEGKKP